MPTNKPLGSLYTTCRILYPIQIPPNKPPCICTPHAEYLIHPRCLPTNLQVICTQHAEHFNHPRCLPANLQVICTPCRVCVGRIWQSSDLKLILVSFPRFFSSLQCFLPTQDSSVPFSVLCQPKKPSHICNSCQHHDIYELFLCNTCLYLSDQGEVGGCPTSVVITYVREAI